MENDQKRSPISYKKLAKTWNREAPQQFGMMLDVLSMNGLKLQKQPKQITQQTG